jgi:phage gp29-like protein
MKKFYDRQTGKLTDAKPAPPPTAPLTVVNGRFEPDSMIDWMDVDRVGYVLRSAKGGAVQPLFALYRDILLTDAHLQAEMSKRKLAVLGEQMRVLPYDKTDPADVEAAQACETAIYGCKTWATACAHLLDATLWPVSLVEKVYAPSSGGYDLIELVPVPYHLMEFDSGHLKIRDCAPDGQPLTTQHDADAARYIVHRGHLLSTPDNYGGPMRSLVYWWLASTMSRDWWLRFLDRYGMPFMVGHYSPGDSLDRNLILGAFAAANKLYGLAVSTETQVEMIEASKAGADAYERFLAICQREKSKLILGQTLSAQTDPTGLGSGVATLQADVREDLRKNDAKMLATTLRDQLLTQFCEINGMPGRPPIITWGSVSAADLQAKANLVVAYSQAGLEPDDNAVESLSEESGISLRRKPSLSSPVLPFSVPHPFAARPPTPRDASADPPPPVSADR